MAHGYKIKMEDGSEVGPMTLESVEGWFKQGLVRHDNLVQRPGSYNWVPVSEVLARDVRQAAAAAAKKAPAPAPKPAAQARPRPTAAHPERDGEPAPRVSSASPMRGVVPMVIVVALAGGGFVAYRALVQENKAEPAASPGPAEAAPSSGVGAAEQAKAIDAVLTETPQLPRATIEFLMSQSMAQVLEPHEVFRRAQSLVSRGLPSLSATESRDLGALMQAVYGALPAADRTRLGAYLDRLRGGSLTKPEEDRAMCAVMKAGVLKLSKERRARLQAIFEKAIRAGAARR